MFFKHNTSFRFVVAFLFIIVKLPDVLASSSAFTTQEAQAIVDRHNFLRANVVPEPADMKFMSWDSQLADTIQQYVEQCHYEHGQIEGFTSSFGSSESDVGQNLWVGGGLADNPPNGVSPSQAWFNEIQYYDFATRGCTGICGHYRQVVWAETYAVGCGRQFCVNATEDDGTVKSNVWLIGCNYGPVGNFNNEDPYKEGSNCTKCSSGSGECYNGLCRPCSEHNEECVCRKVCNNCGTVDTSTCTCNCHDGFAGTDCTDLCGDNHEYCNDGWYKAHCTKTSTPYVAEKCLLMCGKCAAGDPNECDEYEA